MGKINLTPLRVRKRALADLGAGRIPTPPVWLDIVANNPPAQILTRQQPHKHELVKIRTRALPGTNGKTQQIALTEPRRKSKSAKASRMFAPVEIKYEEDQLRKRFFQDHPWELARPRTLVETDGNQHQNSDYSKGLVQPDVSLSGESVVQRQLYLLNNVPDITVDQAYDVARREFYTLRRQEEVKRRIAKEEAMHMGAEPEKGVLEWSVPIEDAMYKDWEDWSKQQVSEQISRNAAFSGAVTAPGEQEVLEAQKSARADIFSSQQKLDSKVIHGSYA